MLFAFLISIARIAAGVHFHWIFWVDLFLVLWLLTFVLVVPCPKNVGIRETKIIKSTYRSEKIFGVRNYSPQIKTHAGNSTDPEETTNQVVPHNFL